MERAYDVPQNTLVLVIVTGIQGSIKQSFT
jgi:hypothetical protein